MPRSIWGGAISFGLVNVPVKLVSAVQQKDVRFHQLEVGTNARVRQKRVPGEHARGPLGLDVPPQPRKAGRVGRRSFAHEPSPHRGLGPGGPVGPRLLLPGQVVDDAALVVPRPAVAAVEVGAEVRVVVQPPPRRGRAWPDTPPGSG